jgi:hypothetical protein
LELAELRYRAAGWGTERRLIVVRQSVKRKTVPGKTLSLFADDPAIRGRRYGAFVTTLDLPVSPGRIAFFEFSLRFPPPDRVRGRLCMAWCWPSAARGTRTPVRTA